MPSDPSGIADKMCSLIPRDSKLLGRTTCGGLVGYDSENRIWGMMSDKVYTHTHTHNGYRYHRFVYIQCKY